jgi:hypothetical protein
VFYCIKLLYRLQEFSCYVSIHCKGSVCNYSILLEALNILHSISSDGQNVISVQVQFSLLYTQKSIVM